MGSKVDFSAITKEHNLAEFDCGDSVLNSWLSKQAVKNSNQGYSKVYVLSILGRVIAYYAISAGAIERKEVPSNLSRNAPNPIPVVVLGRLAVDVDFQQSGYGSALMKDCVIRVSRLSEEVGVKAILVHALNEDAAKFYLSYGFKESRFDSNVLLLPTP